MGPEGVAVHDLQRPGVHAMYHTPSRIQSQGPLLPAGSWVAQSPTAATGPLPAPASWGNQSPLHVGHQSSFAQLGTLRNVSPPTTVPGPIASASSTTTLLPAPSHRPSKNMTTPHQGNQNAKLECQDQQCVEEECDPEECGDERRPPRDDNHVCGIDKRPMLPVVLATSTFIGAVHMMLLEFPLIRGFCHYGYYIKVFFLALYTTTLVCMAYCALCDPGQLKYSSHLKKSAASAQDLPLPKRAHKTWLYKLPIRRYDHYCRWVTNCIGLLNHREFVVMVFGLVMIGVCGSILDIVLVIFTARQGGSWITSFFLLLHVSYSMALTALAGPILRLHIGFVCRNELANEWKRNDFYVVQSSKTGQPVPVNELSDDEFNERFEAFEYDKQRNSFDKNAITNCWVFWCTPRWDPKQLGEF